MTMESRGADRRVRTVAPDDVESLSEVTRLFTEYAEWLAPIVARTTIALEIASLPAPFAPPDGRLLVASAQPGGAICGCVGVKRHSDSAAEIKRLFVREGCRGIGLGRSLFLVALDAACELGYEEALVSTIPSHMATANAMYERLGFEPTQRFERHTLAEVDLRYLRLELGDWCA
jgi:putative acetyltransferase